MDKRSSEEPAAKADYAPLSYAPLSLSGMQHEYPLSDLDAMAKAVHYHAWLWKQVADYVGRATLEIGCGIGTYTGRIAERSEVLAIDASLEAIGRVREAYAGDPRVRAEAGSIESIAQSGLVKAGSVDTIVCFNVLEHIQDDEQSLEKMSSWLAEGGYLLLIVPALPWLYGSIDRLVGHHRRYSKSELQDKVDSAGFVIEKLYYLNCVGVPAWFYNNRIIKMQHESLAQIGFYDRWVVPWLSRIEARIRPPIGMSLVCIARNI